MQILLRKYNVNNLVMPAVTLITFTLPTLTGSDKILDCTFVQQCSKAQCRMGNELCVAGGGTPMLVDILVVNNTEIPLNLDRDQDCQRDCHHKGFQELIQIFYLYFIYKEIF